MYQVLRRPPVHTLVGGIHQTARYFEWGNHTACPSEERLNRKDDQSDHQTSRFPVAYEATTHIAAMNPSRAWSALVLAACEAPLSVQKAWARREGTQREYRLELRRCRPPRLRRRAARRGARAGRPASRTARSRWRRRGRAWRQSRRTCKHK
jgi:hypothetical protein